AADAEEHRPAEQEGGERAERVAQIDVEAAGLGVHGPELRERERAEDGEDPRRDPDREGQGHAPARVAEHGGRDQPDARSDDRAHDEEGDVARGEHPGEGGTGFLVHGRLFNTCCVERATVSVVSRCYARRNPRSRSTACDITPPWPPVPSHRILQPWPP